MQEEEKKPLYEKLIYQNDLKAYQLKVVVSEFREVEYLHIRKYFQSYEGEFVPSKEGISVPLSIEVIELLAESLIELCAEAESTALLHKYLREPTETVS